MAQQTVVRFNEGFTNLNRFPFVTAILTCGHHATVAMKPTRGRCWRAEACTAGAPEMDVQTGQTTHCPCGSSGFTIVSFPNAHKAADRITQVGDVVECDHCDREAVAVEEMRAALQRPDFSHTRFRYESVHAYRRDPSSPSGVFLICSLSAKRFDPLFNEMRAAGLIRSGAAPLSPTEPGGGRER